MCTNKFLINGLIGVHVSSIVNEVIRTTLGLFILFYFFLRIDFERTKTQIKPKPTNKTKTNKQKQQKQQVFARIKTF